MSSAEAVAKVIRDVRRGGFNIESPWTGDLRSLAHEALVVDVTPVYFNFVGNSANERSVYDDYVLNPPWENVFLGYENASGNVLVMHVNVLDSNDVVVAGAHWESQSDTHVIDWDRVRWVYSVLLFSGGRHSSGISVPTMGPLIWWRIAVYEDGQVADLHWRIMNEHFPDEHIFDNAVIALLDTINLCNCVNVIVVEPDRSARRAERRRLERTGVTVSEIHVRPVSKSYRGKGQRLMPGDTPLSSVRGHFASYGPRFGRGLLFGKYEGRFWIPQHVRGAAEFGEVEQSYVMEAE